MIIFIIEPISKSNENVISLSQVVKVKSSIIKVKEIINIANATIINYKTTEFLKNKSKKILKEM